LAVFAKIESWATGQSTKVKIIHLLPISTGVDMKKIESLVERARLSDANIAEQHRAFNELVERFQDMAYGCAYAVLGDFQLAEDATQEAFIIAYQQLGQLRTPQAFAGWLRRIVLSQCNRLTRRKTMSTEPIEAAFDIVSMEEDPAGVLVAEEITARILTAIRRLPENQRRVIQLFYIDGYSREEISEVLNVPVTTVNNWLYASRQRLKATLNPDLIEGEMLEMVRDKLREGRLCNIERLFNAIELGEIDSVKELLKLDPTLSYAKYNRGTQWKEEPIIDETPLHAAADSGAKEIVDVLLANGSYINAKRSDGNTPLHLAASVGSFEVVECLIRNGADVRARNDWQGTPLHLAARHENTDIATVLLQNGADVHAEWQTPLHVAAWHGNIAMAELLLRHGADVNVTDPPLLTPLHSAVRNNQREMVEFLLDHGAEVNAESDVRRRPLHLAARSGNVEIIKLLLQRGADINAYSDWDGTPIHAALREGNAEVAMFLISRGCDLMARDPRGRTPLHAALRAGLIDVIEELLQRGVDIQVKNNRGNTPLHTATQGGLTEMVERLLSLGASVNAQNNWDNTPLHSAAWYGHSEIAEMLLKHGADVNAKEQSGKTALQLAIQRGHESTANLLRQHRGEFS